MLALLVPILSLTPLAVSVALARFWADTEKDAWLMMISGIVGTGMVAIAIYLDFCVKKKDAEEENESTAA
jgi:hypothetical protein